MRYTSEDRVAASRLFLFINEKWRVRGIRDANLQQVGWHILISQFEGKKTNPHGISLALDEPYETVRQRVNRLLETPYFCRSDDDNTLGLCSGERRHEWDAETEKIIDNLLAVAADINARRATTEIR